MEVLVIGDLHLRPFWKDAVNKWDGQIIFLGDELDPYPHEWEDKVMPNPINYLIEVLNFKDNNRERVTLLIGNHAFCYMYEGYNASRMDIKNWNILNQLYNEDKDLFQIAKQIDDTLFTHAGVSKSWLNRHNLTLPKDDADVFLNEIYKTTPNIFWEVSWDRGGLHSTGSPIWHDVRELDIEPDHYNVFGHSQTKKDPIKKDNWICLDCRRAFIFDTINYKIKELE